MTVLLRNWHRGVVGYRRAGKWTGASPDGPYNQRPTTEAEAPQPSKIMFTRLISGRLQNLKALDSIYPTG